MKDFFDRLDKSMQNLDAGMDNLGPSALRDATRTLAHICRIQNLILKDITLHLRQTPAEDHSPELDELFERIDWKPGD